MVAALITFVLVGLFNLINFFVGLLPSFSLDVSSYVGLAGDYLGYLNWFIPVGTIVSITLAWLAALLVYQAYKGFAGFFRTFTQAAQL